MGKLMSVEAARAAMLAEVPGVVAETLPAEAALGRVLAEDVRAERDQPPFAASAMDGYAIAIGPPPALSPPANDQRKYRVIGESAAGHAFTGALKPGEAVRIFTGAAVPEGADLVAPQEIVARDGDRISLTEATHPGRHIRPRGGDFPAGEVLLQKGQRLDPWRLSLAAAAGRAKLTLARRPRVALLTTGEEIVAPGTELRLDQIYDSGTPALAGLLAQWGGELVATRRAGDTEAAILDAVQGLDVDLLITVGGASVGDHDLVKPALGQLGLDIGVESVAVRPGKPTWFGQLKDGRLVLGLPGNPASALVCAELFLKPLVLAWQGAAPGPALIPAQLATPLPAHGPREAWLRARLEVSPQGVLTATPFRDQDSSLVSVFAAADALLRRPAHALAAEAGSVAEVLRLDRFQI
ncbi:MAG: gephyrin-like molybdotransferase Glp [Pseudomonadota bacterium]